MIKDTLAIRAHKGSIANASAGNKAAWLALFDENAAVYDPVGPSPHDPEGKGAYGLTEIAQFWDRMIGPLDLTLIPHKRIPCGDKVAAVIMTAAIRAGGAKSFIEMVAIYEVNEAGKIIVLKIYWDVDAAAEQVLGGG